MDLTSFELSSVPAEETREYAPIPNGKYRAMIIESEQRLTRKAKASSNAADGTMLYLKLCITDGDFQGRWLFSNINLRSQYAFAQEIGRRMLRDIYVALGKESVVDSSELHDQPLVVTVKVKESEWNGEKRVNSEVVKYESE